MGKHWVRQQVKHNELQDVVDKVVLWIAANRQTAAIAAGALLLVVLLSGFVVYRTRSLRTEAWDKLALAQSLAYGGKLDDSLKHLQELSSAHPGSGAWGYGLLFTGDILFPRGRYKEAVETYSRVLERGEPKPLQAVALGDVAIAQEAAGQCQQASQTAQRFLDAHSDHFLAPQVHASLARCLEALGQADQSKGAWQKIALQYPDTSWAETAQRRLKGGLPNIPTPGRR